MWSLLPPDVSPGFALRLLVASTSALTGAFGPGGAALPALMAQGPPVAAPIPVHGAARPGSDLGRAVVRRAHVDWPTIRRFERGFKPVMVLLAADLAIDGLEAFQRESGAS